MASRSSGRYRLPAHFSGKFSGHVRTMCSRKLLAVQRSFDASTLLYLALNYFRPRNMALALALLCTFYPRFFVFLGAFAFHLGRSRRSRRSASFAFLTAADAAARVHRATVVVLRACASVACLKPSHRSPSRTSSSSTAVTFSSSLSQSCV